MKLRGRVKIAVAAGVLLIVAYVGWRLRGMEYETPVRLPYASEGFIRDASTGHVIHLTVEGDVYHGDAPVTLEELRERTDDERPVLVCADRNATYTRSSSPCLSQLHEAGIRRYRLVGAEVPGPAVLNAPVLPPAAR